MADPKTFYFALPPPRRLNIFAVNEQLHPDFGWLTSNRSRSRGRDAFEIIDTVVIHATAGYATQHAVENWRQRAASAHWIIPDEDEHEHGAFVWATVAESMAAYHVRDSIDVSVTELGDGPNVNDRSLGIEIVNTQNVENYQDRFSSWQVAMAAQITLCAWAKYPRLKHVISHAALDPSRRGDPGGQFPWAGFRDSVLGHAR